MTIQVLVDTFKKEIYKVVTDYYNQNKPDGWTELISGRFDEGGFEMALDTELLQKQLGRGYRDTNQLVRQVRWNHGKLVSGWQHIPFTDEQTELLFRALQHGFGVDKVVMV